MSLLSEVDQVVEERRLALWEQCRSDALERLNLDQDQRDRVACFRYDAQAWTCQQLAVFLRDTEAAIWTTHGENFAVHGKVWVAHFILAQAELGQRLGQWPPELDPPSQ